MRDTSLSRNDFSNIFNSQSRNDFNNKFIAIKCFHCKKEEHIKRNCPIMKHFSFKKKLNDGNVVLLEDNSDSSYEYVDVLVLLGQNTEKK